MGAVDDASLAAVVPPRVNGGNEGGAGAAVLAVADGVLVFEPNRPPLNKLPPAAGVVVDAVDVVEVDSTGFGTEPKSPPGCGAAGAEDIQE